MTSSNNRREISSPLDSMLMFQENQYTSVRKSSIPLEYFQDECINNIKKEHFEKEKNNILLRDIALQNIIRYNIQESEVIDYLKVCKKRRQIIIKDIYKFGITNQCVYHKGEKYLIEEQILIDKIQKFKNLKENSQDDINWSLNYSLHHNKNYALWIEKVDKMMILRENSKSNI